MPTLVISRVKKLANIDTETNEDLIFEEIYPNPFEHDDDYEPIDDGVYTGVVDEWERNPETGKVIAIPVVGMEDNQMEDIPGVEMEDIEILGVDNTIPVV